MEERHQSGFEPQLTADERRALRQRARQARHRRTTWVGFLGLGALALFVVGCPEPGDLANPDAWPAPTPAGGSGSSGGSAPTAGTGTAGTGTAGTGMAGMGTAGTGMGNCEVACVNALFQPATSACGLCHNPSVNSAGLDLQTAGYSARLKDKPATFKEATVSDCPAGAKLIDSAMPANSWLLKKVHGDQDKCGAAMPIGTPLTAAETTCLDTYVTCVAGGT